MGFVPPPLMPTPEDFAKDPEKHERLLREWAQGRQRALNIQWGVLIVGTFLAIVFGIGLATFQAIMGG